MKLYNIDVIDPEKESDFRFKESNNLKKYAYE